MLFAIGRPNHGVQVLAVSEWPAPSDVALAIWLLTHHQTCSQFRFCELADPKGVVAFVMQLDWLTIEIGWSIPMAARY